MKINWKAALTYLAMVSIGDILYRRFENELAASRERTGLGVQPDDEVLNYEMAWEGTARAPWFPPAA